MSVKIKSIEKIGKVHMYDLRVNEAHCYSAEGLWTHNSGEPVYCDALRNDEDLHMKVAKLAFGVEDRAFRDKMKTCSFLKNYGGEPPTLAKRLKISLSEAENIFVLYDKTLAHLTRWKKSVIDYARKNGMVFTYYGRPRILWQYYASPEKGMKAFADRSAVNSILQGCLPSESFIEGQRAAYKLDSFYGKSLVTFDNREGISTHRGEGQYVMLWSESGEFIVCDTNHELLSKSKETGGFKCHNVSQGLNSYVLTSRLQSKRLPNPFKVAKCDKNSVGSTLVSWTRLSSVSYSPSNNNVVWAAYLKGVKMSMDPCVASSLRTILSIFGFNLLYDSHDDLYYLSAFREKEVYFTHFKLLRTGPIASLTMRWGYQYYSASGFLNKNTGADIMRQLLCRVYNAYEVDPELRDNFILAWHVHDEVNGYIKKEWIHKGFLFLQETQTVVHDNWIVPLEAETGIGTNWGNGVDVEYVSPEGRFLPKKDTFFNEEDYLNEREKCGLPRYGKPWKTKKVVDFYERQKHK